MTDQRFTVTIRGDDDLDIRSKCRNIGVEQGWSVAERSCYSDTEERQVAELEYSQRFDDHNKADQAVDRLERAINEVSSVAIVIT